MAQLWDSLSLDAMSKIEDLLTEDEYIHLRYLCCACVAAKVSNDYGIVSYITYNVLKNWGYGDVKLVPAMKRSRTVGTPEEAQNFFNPKFTDSVQGDRIKAEIATVCIYPCKLQDEDEPSNQMAFVAITDLYMLPELDEPIYCMQKRNALSPLASVPTIKVNQYALLHDREDSVCQMIESRMGRADRDRLQTLREVCAADEPGRRFYRQLSDEKKRVVDEIIARFQKPFAPEAKPGEEFFRYF
jgi:hypothetical protein